MNDIVVRLSILLFGFLMVQNLKGQEVDMKKYEWESRIVLIISKNGDDPKCLNQIQMFGGFSKELEERKLVVYEIQSDKYRIINYNKNEEKTETWNFSEDLYNQYASKNDEFRVVLIGLDGGVKLRSGEVENRVELFKKIDSMPMRSAELKAKRN